MAREEQPLVPPPGVPIRNIKPTLTDGYFVELVELQSTGYEVLTPGTQYSTIVGAKQDIIDQFGPLYFLKEVRLPNSDQAALRYWATDEQASDTNNAEITYLADSIAHPAFARVYNVRRDLYEAAPSLTVAQPLTALLAIRLITGGSGYTTASVIIGGPGTGAEAEAVITDGVITDVSITKQGIGFTSPPRIEIEGDGDGAESVAIIQPQSAVLTSQTKQELPADDPMSNQFVRVMRVYETLPGPYIPFTRYDDNLGPIQGRRRIVLNTGQIASLTGIHKITYEGRASERLVGGSSVVLWEIEEMWSDGTGTAGNPAYPIGTSDDYDKTRGPVQITTQVVVATGSEVGSLSVSGGIATYTHYEVFEGYSPFLLKKVVETWAVPGVSVPAESVNEDGTTTVTTRTLALASAITEGETVSGGFWTKTSSEAYSETMRWKVVAVRPIPGNPMVTTSIDKDGDVMTETRTLSQTSGITTTTTIIAGVWTKTFEEAVSDLVAWKVVQVRSTAHALPFYSIEIPDLVPTEFRGVAPTSTTETTVKGTASMPTIGVGDIFRSQQQLDEYTYRLRVTTRAGLSFPITLTQHETTTEFGGGDLNVISTLDDSALTIDTGLLVVSSETKDLANTLFFKVTRSLNDTDWPTLSGQSFDKEMQVDVFEEQQVVVPSYAPTPGTYFVESLVPVDKWRSRRVKSTKEPTAISLATALIEEVDGPYSFPGLVYLNFAATGYFVKRSSAQLCQQIIKTWWLHKTTKPTRGLPGSGMDVEVQDIIMDDIIISTLNDVTQAAYSGMALHDTITTFGVFVWPETTPSATDYIALIGTEIVVAASIEPTDIPELWKIQTKSLIAR